MEMPNAPSSASLRTLAFGSRRARVGSPNGSRPVLPTVQSPKLNLSAGVGVSDSVSLLAWTIAPTSCAQPAQFSAAQPGAGVAPAVRRLAASPAPDPIARDGPWPPVTRPHAPRSSRLSMTPRLAHRPTDTSRRVAGQSYAAHPTSARPGRLLTAIACVCYIGMQPVGAGCKGGRNRLRGECRRRRSEKLVSG